MANVSEMGAHWDPHANENVGRKVGVHCGKQRGTSPQILRLPCDSAISFLGSCPEEQKEDPDQTLTENRSQQ